jgi:hypothetical protein
LALKKLSPLSLETGGRNPAKLEACTLDGFLLQPDRNPRMQHLMMQEQESPNNRQFCQGVPRNTTTLKINIVPVWLTCCIAIPSSGTSALV